MIKKIADSAVIDIIKYRTLGESRFRIKTAIPRLSHDFWIEAGLSESS